ncbi:MAG: hypothetical protein P4L65_02255 [Legionella sp.]|nr:hypothetical protein [Legionella sp.]
MKMINGKQKKVMLLFCFTFSAFAAKQPELTLEPLTDPVLEMAAGDLREIQYQLVNHGTQSHTLKMKPVNGVSQKQTKAEDCSDEIHLEPGASCLLNLVVDINQAAPLEQKGPMLCDENNADKVCVQPESQARLSAHYVSTDLATLSVEIKKHAPNKKGLLRGHCFASYASQCTLVLFQSTDTNGDLVVTNTSGTPARFVQAYNLPVGVTQDASGCTYLAPGASCDLQFFPGTIRNVAGTAVTIRGTNTPTSTITMQVLGIGDLYAGGPLFQLPTSSNTNFYTSSLADAGTGINWAAADALCTGFNDLPAPAQLTTLFQASNCNGGPIGGFTCATSYWGTAVNATNANAISFTTGVRSSVNKATLFSARCIQGYQLVPV